LQVLQIDKTPFTALYKSHQKYSILSVTLQLKL